MAGIDVLSDTLKVGSKIEKTSIPKGKTAAESAGNAATGFAEVLSGKINPTADSKGQKSKACQDSEDKQITKDSVKGGSQNSNELGSMLGYGNFALPFLAQLMLQSDLPAGKEANSGKDVSQGTGSVSTANSSLTDNASVVAGNNLKLAMLNLLSLASDEVSAGTGMATPKSQGDNLAITELDKYRQVIADLLEKLSGEITDTSPKGNRLSLKGAGSMDLRQEMAKIVQGWMAVTDDVTEDGQASNGQKGIQPLLDVSTAGIGSGDPALNAKVSTLLAALYPKLSQGSQGTEGAEASQGMNATIQGKDDIIDPAAKESSEPFLKQLKGTDLNPVATQVKDTALLTNVQLKSNEMSTQKGDSTHSTELSGGKDVQNQNSSVSIGVQSNIITANVADGKTVATPVWEQISTAIREQVMNRSQDLKQLDIQLHPADLGKIQIDLHWENGQLHLQVHASQATTGQLLQNQLPDLRQALANQGVNCGMLQMGQGGERQQNSHGDESRRTFNQNTNLNEDEDLISGITPLSLVQGGQGEINLINVTA